MTGKGNQPDKAAELRRQAEEKARSRAAGEPPDLAALPAEEARRMVHELRVRQIELEMQNEELRRAQAELDAARARYFDLYDLAPVGYFAVSEKGLILEANLTAAGLWGVTRGALAGQPLTRFIFKEDQDIYDRHRKALFETGRPQSCELRMMKPDGATFWAGLGAVVAREADGETVCRVTMRVITGRKKAEAALRESEERLRFTLESCHIGTWDVDLADDTAVRSLEHARIFGYEQLQPIWSREMFLEHVLPEDRVPVGEKIQRAIQTQSDFSFECRIRRVDGQIRWIWVAGRYRVDSGGKGRHLAGVVQDITERKDHEAETERLSRIYAALSQVNQAIVRVRTLEELVGEVTRVTVRFAGFRLAWIGRHNAQTSDVVPLGWAGEPGELVRDFRHGSKEDAGQRCPCGLAIRNDRPYVLNDLSSERGMRDWHSVLESAGIRAAAVFPIRVRGSVWGVFGVYEGEPNVFQDKEIALLEEAAMDIGYAIEHIDNEAQRRQAEQFQLLSTTILGILNEPLPLREASNAILALIKKATGLDAVGIRLKNGDDFPYFSAEGLDKEFLLAENSVILRTETGAACRDADGQLCLEYTCGMVLAEKCGPPSEHVTAAGSIWTNDSLASVESLSGPDPRLKPRNRCVHEGFLSVALIPIRVDQQVIGLLHLNDRRKDRFTPETIRFFEGLTASFGIAVKRKQAEDSLRESEARFRSLIEGAPEAIFVQCGGILQYVNRAMVELVGAARAEDLLGRPFLDRVAAEFHAVIRERIRAQRDSGAVAPLMEQEYLRLDGTPVPVETTAVAIRFQGQDGHLVFVRDTTQRREAAKERMRLEAQLHQAQKMESVGRLAGGVAHDFNNMLGIILGYSEHVLEQLHRSDPLREQVQEVIAAARRSADLTRQLLAFSRKQVLKPEVLDLNALIRNLDKMLRRLIDEDIELVLSLADDLAPVLVDPGPMEQVVVNLALNARDAMPTGGKLIIETANATLDETEAAQGWDVKPGPYVRLVVTDTGCGMDKEVLSQVFEPFFTTKEAGKGTGLGLPTVHGIIKQSGGGIAVRSEPGRGTTFEICLPQTEHPRQADAGRAEKRTPAERGGSVLVVEDEELLRQLLGTTLSRLGFQITLAANGGEALTLVEEKGLRPDLIITDVVMAGINGPELVARLRETQPGLRMLYMSGCTDDTVARRGLDPNVPFIQKPFSVRELGEKIRTILQPAVSCP